MGCIYKELFYSADHSQCFIPHINTHTLTHTHSTHRKTTESSQQSNSPDLPANKPERSFWTEKLSRFSQDGSGFGQKQCPPTLTHWVQQSRSTQTKSCTSPRPGRQGSGPQQQWGQYNFENGARWAAFHHGEEVCRCHIRWIMLGVLSPSHRVSLICYLVVWHFCIADEVIYNWGFTR